MAKEQDVGMWWLIGSGTIVGGIILYGAYKAYVKSRNYN